MKKLVYESLQEYSLNEKADDKDENARKKEYNGKAKTSNLDKIASIKQSIAGLKVQLKDAKKTGKLSGTMAQKNLKIDQIQGKIDKFQEKLEALKESYINESLETLNEGLDAAKWPAIKQSNNYDQLTSFIQSGIANTANLDTAKKLLPAFKAKGKEKEIFTRFAGQIDEFLKTSPKLDGSFLIVKDPKSGLWKLSFAKRAVSSSETPAKPGSV